MTPAETVVEAISGAPRPAARPTGALLELRSATREYRTGEITVHALRGVDLDIDAGQVVVLLGPSGSGKTTLLNLVGGLDSPTHGEVLVAGEAIAGYDARRLADYRARTVGFVFQFFNLIPSLTAAENIEFALALVEADHRAAARRARELLDRVGLGDRVDHFPAQLSGGQQQRVAIARALANRPRLLLCDEPTGNLDVETGRQVLQVLESTARDDDATVLLVTHNAAIAPMADRVLATTRRPRRARQHQPAADPARRARLVSRHLLARKTVRELRASRAQTLALAAVVALGVTVFVAAIGAYRDLATSEAATYNRLKLASVWYRTDPADQALADEVAARPNVEAAEGRLVVDVGLQIGTDRARARLIGTRVTEPASVNDVAIIGGQRPSSPGQVLLERTFADRRGLAPGDTIVALIGGQPVPLQVAATVSTPEYLQVTPDRYELLPAPSSFAVVFLDRAQLQELTGNQGRINELVVRLDDDDPATLDALEQHLRSRTTVTEAVSRADQASYAALEQDLGSFRAVAIAMPAVILLAGIAAMAVMLGRVVRSQRPIIGVMKALGYSDRTVLGHYLTYAAVIGSLGGAVGVLAGSVLSGVITRAYTGEIGVPYTTSTFHPALAGLAVGVSLIAVTVAAWRPARRSAQLPPALATRIDPTGTDRPGQRSRLEQLVPLPLAARLPLRTAARARGRSAGTAGGIAAALVLLVMVLALGDAVGLFVTRALDDRERWDIAVTLDQPRDPATLTAITQTPGVTDASPFYETPARLQAGDHRQDVLLTALAPEQNLRLLRLGNVEPAEALSPGHIVLTDGLAADLDVTAGDTLTATTPAGPVTLTVGGTSDEPIPRRAYISLDTAAQVAGAPVANGVYLETTGDTGAIRSNLYDQPGVTAVAVRDEQRADLRSLLSVFNALIAVMLVFAVAMAFAVLFNAMTINVLEREREYATMRALGARPMLIARLLATEATLLWTLALVPGLAAGAWVAARLGDAIAADLFILEVRATPGSYLLAAGGVLAIALLSLLLPLRRVARLDLAAATKTLG